MYLRANFAMALVILLSAIAKGQERVNLPKKTTSEVIGATAKIDVHDIPFPSRVDTGATTTSIHAQIVSVANEDRKANVVSKSDEGKSIRFVILNETDHDQCPTKALHKSLSKECNAKIIRVDKVNGKYRAFVKLPITWIGKTTEVEVNLADRSHRMFPLLVGRNYLLQRAIVVDVAQNKQYK